MRLKRLNRWFCFLVWLQADIAPAIDYGLVGVLTGTQDRPGVALVEGPGGRRWLVERQTFDGWTVDRIERQRVVLRRGREITTIGSDLMTLQPHDTAVVVPKQVHDYVVGPGLHDQLMSAGSYPVIGPSGLRGWGLRWIDTGSIYDLLGFQDDDVVTEIDGRPLTDVEVTLTLLRRLTTDREVTLKVERDGQPFDLRISLPY
jgi:type II secretory pathway component PulC